jgi:TniQ
LASYWRRLPITLPPAQNETVASWLHRLATVHGLPSGELRQHLHIGTRGADIDKVGHGLRRRLAAVTGHPVEALVWALPELRAPAADWPALRHLAQRACPRCTVRYEGGPVRRLFAHREYLCVGHGYWIGPPDPTRDDPQPHLVTAVPELLAAQRRLDRAERRYGWAATFDATAAATSICIDLRFGAEAHPLWNRWERRLQLLMPTGYQRSLFIAAIFPEVAALASVLAAAQWRVPAPRPDTATEDRLIHLATTALGCVDRPRQRDLGEALIGWMAYRAASPPLQPAATFPDTGHHDDGTPRVSDPFRLAEHLTAVQFQRDRRAPRTHSPAASMPYAHRPATTSTQTTRTGRTR